MAARTHAAPVASPSETIPSIPLGYTAGCGFFSALTPFSRQASSPDQLYQQMDDLREYLKFESTPEWRRAEISICLAGVHG